MKITRENIKLFVISLLSKIKSFIADMYSLPHSKKYIAFASLMFIFFLIITFPYDSLVKKKIYGFEGNKLRSIEMSDFDFSIFGETYIKNINVVFNNGSELSCKNSIINATINPFTLFIKNKLKSDFQFDLLKYSNKDIEMIFNINGNIDTVIDQKSGIPTDGPVKIILTDSTIKLGTLNIPGPMGPLPLKLEAFTIQSGNIDSIITKSILRFNKFKLSGSDISCDMIGSIDLINNSLDLLINIDSDSSVLDQYREILASYIKNNTITLRIKGSISRPELSLSNSAKNEN